MPGRARRHHGLRARGDRSRGRDRAQTRAAAETACALVDASAPALDGCLAALDPLRGLDPDDLTARQLADAAGRAHAARCGRGAEDPSTAIRQVRCAEAREAWIATPAFHAEVTARRAHAAARLLALAAEDAQADRAGAQVALIGAASCLAPTDELNRRRDQANAAFVTGARNVLVVRTRGDLPGEVCSAVAAGLGVRVSCGPDVEGAIVIEAATTIDSVAHAAWEEQRSVRYLAGVDRQDNPAYRVRADDEAFSREQMRDSERRWRRDDEACDEASRAYEQTYCTDCAEVAARDRTCEHAKVSEELFRQREADWERARRELDATPAVLEHEDWRDASYTVVTHRWTAAWSAAVITPDGGRERVAGATERRDEEHRGVRAADLGADPLTTPSGAWYLPAIREQVVAELTRVGALELGRRVHALRAQCADDVPAWSADWLDCWATATMWSGASPAGDALLRVEAAADDRRAPAGLPAPSCR